VTILLLVRHALCDPVGRSIAGRTPGVHLNATGRAEAERLGHWMSALSLAAVYSSPLERAVETATFIAQAQQLPISTAAGLNEIDFGEWTGKTLDQLNDLPEWRRFNNARSSVRIPGGENTAEVLSRALSEVDRVAAAYSEPNTLVALVSHGDVLRLLLLHYLGVPIDLIHRLEISTASVSAVAIGGHEPRVLLVNSTPEWSSLPLFPGKG
jgi:broad specificity phosphatase PhoE